MGGAARARTPIRLEDVDPVPSIYSAVGGRRRRWGPPPPLGAAAVGGPPLGGRMELRGRRADVGGGVQVYRMSFIGRWIRFRSFFRLSAQRAYGFADQYARETQRECLLVTITRDKVITGDSGAGRPT